MKLVVTNPHAGTRLTDYAERKIRPYISRTEREQLILDQSDLGAGAVYDMSGFQDVTELKGEYSRLVVDLNRPLRNALPLTDMDGEPLYKENGIASGEAELRSSIWKDYHDNIAEALSDDSILLDVHTMKDKNGRPDICIGTGHGKFTNADITVYLFSGIYSLFKDMGVSIATNHPYSGGYIPSEYAGKEKRAASLEMKRSLFTDGRGAVNKEKAEELNDRFRKLAERLLNYTSGSSFYLSSWL
ncbi:MAG: N-formylglutamate amidohydrolase [Candidatus Aenigmarchaeota archaeon]|nr:N-formylglutamate amidohydrolase [Candidatus Aenigmarchaeota archaeon]